MFVSCHKTITELHQAPDLLELCVKIFITVNIDERASSMPEKNLSGFFFIQVKALTTVASARLHLNTRTELLSRRR